MADKLVIAQSIVQAAELKGPDSAFLAGGTEDNRLDSPVCAGTLVSLRKIGMKEIEKCRLEGFEDPFIRLGAMCTFSELEESGIVPDYLKTALRFMSSLQKRNMATIGGNVACARDDSYLLATLIAAKAKIEFTDKDGKKTYTCACKYVADRSKYENCLISAVYLHDIPMTVESKRYANTAASHAYLTVAASYVKGDTIFAVCAKNCGIFTFKNEKPGVLPFKNDIFGSPEYKQYLLDVTYEDLIAKVTGGRK